jgi:cyclophilin family peptidyl-prolyl cis-trans isomerase
MQLPDLARKLLELVGRPGRRRRGPRKAPDGARARLELLPLEDRCVPAAILASSTVSGVAYIDDNHNGRHDSSEVVLVGAPVTFLGTTNQGRHVSATAVTAGDGSFRFLNVLPGTYHLQGDSTSNFLGGTRTANFTVGEGKSLFKPVSFGGINPALLTLRSLTSDATGTNVVGTAPGTGFALANYRANHKPEVKTAIANVSVTQGTGGTAPAPTQIDLAANFTDSDFRHTLVRIDTSMGPIHVALDDAAAPQTVANFLNYVLAHRYDSTIFHRLAFLDEPTDKQPFALQGGGFKFSTSGTQGQLDKVATAADPGVKNEPDKTNRPNKKGTIAMAKSAPDNAKDEFFFNLANNATLDDPNNSGGFTVFGKIVSAADQGVINKLASLPIKDERGASPTDPTVNPDPNNPFKEVPLKDYTGAPFKATDATEQHFTTDAKAGNFEVIKDVKVLRRDEFLHYTATSSNPSVVTTQVVNNHLTLTYASGATAAGTANITVQAIDRYGAIVTTTFKVTVAATP